MTIQTTQSSAEILGDISSVKALDQAYQIALDTLRSNYTSVGIKAGHTHFADVWTRDCCFAGLGALTVRDYDEVMRSIRTCIKYQRDDGQIPLRVGQKHFLKRYFHLSKNTLDHPEPVYIEDKYISKAVDCNPLFLILTGAYARETSDIRFLSCHYQSFQKAVHWCMERANSELLMKEGAFAGWADSIKKKGVVSYSNILLCEGVRQMAAIAQIIGKDSDQAAYESMYKKLKHSLFSEFWNGQYFIDWIHRSHKQITFSTEANLLAIIFDLTTTEQSESIFSYIKAHKIDHDFCIDTRYPHYSRTKVYLPFLAINMGDYHNGMKWLWVACLHAVALYKTGHRSQALNVLLRLANKIDEYGGIYEVYENEGRPVRRMFYQSEKSFAWSSGLFVWACHHCDIASK